MYKFLSFLIVICIISCDSPEARRKKAIELNNKAIDVQTRWMLTSDSTRELALDMLNEAIEIDPECQRCYENKLTTLLELGRLKEALKTSKEVMTFDPEHMEIIQFAGMLHDGFGQPDSAMKYYEKAYEIGERRLEEDSTDVLKWISHTFNQFFLDSDIDSVIFKYEKLKEIFPDYQWIHYDDMFFKFDKNEFIQGVMNKRKNVKTR